MKFKKGDFVKVIRTSSSYYNCILQITSYNVYLGMYVTDVDNTKQLFKANELELIKKGDEMKFKIGDKVKLTDDWTNNVVLHFKKYINKDAKIIDIIYQYNTYIIKVEADDRELEVSENQIKLIEKNILEKSKEEIESEICKDNFIYNLFDLQKLLAIRDKFRNGWKPEQNGQVKYCIEFDLSRAIMKTGLYSSTQIFSFETSEQRDRFYDLYKDEIEQILKMLIL